MSEKNTIQKNKKISEAEEFYQKGLLYGEQSDADGVIESWQKTVELNPDHFEAWYNLGNAFDIGRGDLESALKCWNRALELKSDDVDDLTSVEPVDKLTTSWGSIKVSR